MSKITRVRCTNPNTGIIYIYENERLDEPDPDTGKTVYKRRLIGKLDKEGKLVPTSGHRGRPRKSSAPEEAMSEQKTEMEQLQKENQELRGRIVTLSQENQKLTQQYQELVSAIQTALKNTSME